MDYLQIARGTLAEEEKAINRISGQLDAQFPAVVELILSCTGRLVVAGIGKSGLVGKKMAATFSSTGTPSFFLHPTEAFHGDLGMLKSSDVIILISYSGETDDINKLIPSLKDFGNKIIAMTGNPNSTLANNANYVLNINVEREVCPHNLAPTSSAIATMALGDALAICLINARNFQPKDFAKFHPGGNLGRILLTRVADIMQTHLPITHPSTSFADCLNVMNKGRMGMTIVMDNNNLCGVITDGDIRRAFTKYGPKCLRLKASDFMTKQPKVINHNAYLIEAETLMKQLKIHSLIVVDDNHLVVGLVEFSI